jgi:trafficking protein particle complex subunit 12
MRLFNQTSAECTNLFTVINSIQPASARSWLYERLLPFELEVLHAKTKYWAGDHMGYLDALVVLLKRCKQQARQAARKKDQAGNGMWKERGARLCLIIASQLIEMKVGYCQKYVHTRCRGADIKDDRTSSPQQNS